MRESDSFLNETWQRLWFCFSKNVAPLNWLLLSPDLSFDMGRAENHKAQNPGSFQRLYSESTTCVHIRMSLRSWLTAAAVRRIFNSKGINIQRTGRQMLSSSPVHEYACPPNSYGRPKPNLPKR